MLGFVQSWFSPSPSPIGVDFGTDCLRLAQVETNEQENRLIAAASADVPAHVRNDPAARFTFFAQAIRDLLAEGNFRGRRVALNLPASLMHVQHLRLPKMDDEALKKAIAWEARGKLPFDPSQGVIRHIVAGEIYHDQEPKYEIVLMAARRDLVERLLEAAAKARLDVARLDVEPKALIDCFSRVFRRKSDIETSTCFVDIGCSASRAIIAREGRIRFARVIPIGGDHFNRAVAGELHLSLEESRLLRVRLAAAPGDETLVKPSTAFAMPKPAVDPSSEEPGTGFALLSAALSAAQSREATSDPAPSSAAAPEDPAPAATGLPRGQREKVDEACRQPLAKLVEELGLCRRYYEATFPQQPVERLIFVGGEAHQRGLCQQIARELGVAAQVGDPMVRLGKFTEPGIEAVIDRRLPQPAWGIALGLSMGPVAVEEPVGVKET